jgi:hypothetical protein
VSGAEGEILTRSFPLSDLHDTQELLEAKNKEEK